jgi:hypothetical protein
MNGGHVFNLTLTLTSTTLARLCRSCSCSPLPPRSSSAPLVLPVGHRRMRWHPSWPSARRRVLTVVPPEASIGGNANGVRRLDTVTAPPSSPPLWVGPPLVTCYGEAFSLTILLHLGHLVGHWRISAIRRLDSNPTRAICSKGKKKKALHGLGSSRTRSTKSWQSVIHR